MAVTAYCTYDDIADRLSEVGIDLRTDDTPPDSLGRAIERASARVNRYCLRRYTAARLAASDEVRELAADLATYYLCVRRGNPAPAPIRALYEEAIEDLKLVQTGALPLGDAAVRKSSAPVLSNVSVRLWPTTHTRVQRARSTGRPEGYPQRVDHTDPMEYGAGGGI